MKLSAKTNAIHIATSHFELFRFISFRLMEEELREEKKVKTMTGESCNPNFGVDSFEFTIQKLVVFLFPFQFLFMKMTHTDTQI